MLYLQDSMHQELAAGLASMQDSLQPEWGPLQHKEVPCPMAMHSMALQTSDT